MTSAKAAPPHTHSRRLRQIRAWVANRPGEPFLRFVRGVVVDTPGVTYASHPGSTACSGFWVPSRNKNILCACFNKKRINAARAHKNAAKKLQKRKLLRKACKEG